MDRIAKFYKVSFEEFVKDMSFLNLSNDELKTIYDGIILPKRATEYSAGYDFFAPFEIKINTLEKVLVPSGVRCQIEPGYFLSCYPRSGLGCKFKMSLANTVGIIDGDYFNALNEGHIMFTLVNNGDKSINIEKGKGFIQGIFLTYGITFDDDVTEVRSGGFGSTDKKVEK